MAVTINGLWKQLLSQMRATGFTRATAPPDGLYKSFSPGIKLRNGFPSMGYVIHFPEGYGKLHVYLWAGQSRFSKQIFDALEKHRALIDSEIEEKVGWDKPQHPFSPWSVGVGRVIPYPEDMTLAESTEVVAWAVENITQLKAVLNQRLQEIVDEWP